MLNQDNTSAGLARRGVPGRSISVLDCCHYGVFGAFALACVLNLALSGYAPVPASSPHWPVALLAVLAGLTTLLGLARQLSPQNALAAAVVISLVTGLADAGAAAAGYGPAYASFAGPTIPPGVPWFAPILWVVAVLNARGVARLILRRWRAAEYFGFWLIGLAGVLVVLQALALETWAAGDRRYWSWPAGRVLSDALGAPWWHFAGVWLLGVLAQFCAVPWLINKRPAVSPPAYHPLGVWLLLNLVLIAGAIPHCGWLAAGLGGANLLGVSLAALIGGKTARP